MRFSKLLLLVLILISAKSFSQGMAVSSDGAPADISAILDVRSNTQGLLLPRLTETQRGNIPSPKDGLLIFNTTTGNLNMYKAGNWYEIASTCVPQPTTSNPGTNQTVYSTTIVTLAANAPTSGSGAWSITSGAGGNITTPASPTSTFTGVAGNTYTLTWTITTSCAASAGNISITFAVPSCTDGIQNGSETDIDCGGGTCATCATNKNCLVDADCASNACDAISLTCVTSPCADHRKDGNETDVDCGGGTCAGCAINKGCLVDADCSSQACDGITLTCVTTQCANHRKDGTETDVDCGGGTCAGCAITKGCLVDADCTSQACDAITLTCIATQCADHRKDGNETDVDCGGGTCAACSVGKGCLVASDCDATACFPYVSTACSAGICVCATTCSADNQCNSLYYCQIGPRTCVPKQAPGTACAASNQCSSSVCLGNGLCQ